MCGQQTSLWILLLSSVVHAETKVLRIISTDYYDEYHYLVYALSFANRDEQLVIDISIKLFYLALLFLIFWVLFMMKSMSFKMMNISMHFWKTNTK